MKNKDKKVIEKAIKPLANAIYYQGIKDCDNDKEDFDRIDLKPLVEAVLKALSTQRQEIEKMVEGKLNSVRLEKRKPIPKENPFKEKGNFVRFGYNQAVEESNKKIHKTKSDILNKLKQ